MTWLSTKAVAPAMAKRQYRLRARELRLALLEAQSELRDTASGALTLLAGVDGAGKGDTVNLINQWMDPHSIRTHSFDDPSDEELRHPHFWRYWRRLPARGEIGLFLSAWYSEPLLRRVDGAGRDWLKDRLAEIRRFERTLADDGYEITKLWLHLGRDDQERRFRDLESDPLRSWRVTERDWENWRRYERFVQAAEEILEATHTPQCPWHVVDGSDARRRSIAVGDALLRTVTRHTRSGSAAGRADGHGANDGNGAVVVELPRGETGSTPPRSEYRQTLQALQGEINGLHRAARAQGVAVVVVFEGRDAAGKGGAIRRLVPAFDARTVDVVRVGAPSDEELQRHYLWRFWRRLPGAGRSVFFDRSWYGRVLVERVEQLASAAEWGRAYEEINDFEHQMVAHGVVLVKLWLEIDREEQERRFEERQRVAHKRWKLTDEDLRNRERWDDYDAALVDALERTHTEHAPWRVVAANDKRAARLDVLRCVRDRMAARIAAPSAVAG